MKSGRILLVLFIDVTLWACVLVTVNRCFRLRTVRGTTQSWFTTARN